MRSTRRLSTLLDFPFNVFDEISSNLDLVDLTHLLLLHHRMRSSVASGVMGDLS
jgi:hypothetical protein